MFCALPEYYCITDSDNPTMRLIQPSLLNLIKLLRLFQRASNQAL